MKNRKHNIKIREDSKPHMQVYKCSYLDCEEFFVDYRDWQSHKVLIHGESPEFFNRKTFGIKTASLTGASFYPIRHKIDHFMLDIRLSLNEAEERGRVRREQRELRKKRKAVNGTV